MKRTILLVAVTAIFVSCNENQSADNSKKQEVKADSVKTFILSLDSAKKTISLPGQLLPNENAEIRSKVQGYISSIKADIGSKVKKGQVLALIDAPEINTRIKELLEKEKAAYSRYQASKDYFDRINIASKTDGVIANSELERTKNQMLTDESEYKAAQFAVSSNKQIGNYLAVVAPYNGIITKRNIDIGSFVGTTNDRPLFEIEDNKLLRLRVPVPEVYSNAVLIGNIAELSLRSFPDKKFKALLVRKSGTINSDNRTELWEFEIPNSNNELKAGSYADVKLNFTRNQKSFVIPNSAIVTTLERRFVIKVTNNTTQWLDVRPGFNMGDKQEIFGDVKIGDTVVLKGTEEMKSGTKVVATVTK
jgi:RND family efflux transporter MFP subunit